MLIKERILAGHPGGHSHWLMEKSSSLRVVTLMSLEARVLTTKEN
jgi:hypothetical protein